MTDENECYGNILLKRINESEYPCEKVSLASDKDGQKFPIHCIVLAAASKYFTAALGPNFQEGKSEEFVLERTDGATVKAIVDYCYSGSIDLTEENVGKFLTIASSVQLDLLEKKCRRFMSDNLSDSNAFDTLMLADKYSYTDLRQRALDLVCENFKTLPSTAIQKLDHRLFADLLKSGKTKESEELIFSRFLFEWFQDEAAGREAYMPDLLKLVRLDRITLQLDPIGTLTIADKYNFADLRQRALDIVCSRFEKLPATEIQKLDHRLLQELLKCDKIQATEDTVFQRLLEWFQCGEDERRQYMPGLLTLIRLEHITPKYLVETVFDVYERFQYSKHISAEYKRRATIQCSNINIRRYQPIYCVLETFEDQIDNPDAVVRIEKYNNVLNIYEEAVEITLGDRRNCNAILQKNKLFVLGGQTLDDIYLKCLTSYDLSSREECVLPEMNKAREDCTPIVFGKYIYVFGGYDKTEEMKSCECFDTEKNEWKEIKSMNNARWLAASAVLSGYIYVAGGYYGSNTVELYDPKCDEWTTITPMKNARVIFGLIAWNGFLYAIGGHKVMEKYDPYKNCWKEIGSFDGSDLVVNGINIDGQIFVIMRDGKFGEIKIDDNEKCSFVPLGGSIFQEGNNRRHLSCRN